MMRMGLVVAGVAVVLTLLAFAGVSVSRAVDVCVAKGKSVLAAADALDRAPPALVAAVVDAHVPHARQADALSIVLLDRLSCRGAGAGADWVIERPALAWQIGRTFSAREMLGLTVSTMDTKAGPGALGLNAGARRFFHRPLNELNRDDVTCLVRKALGTRRPWRDAVTCDGATPEQPIIN